MAAPSTANVTDGAPSVTAATGLASATSVPNAYVDPFFQNFTMVPNSYTGAFGPNGETLTFNGTIQEVMRQVREINPGYDWDGTGGNGAAFKFKKPEWRDRHVSKKDCVGPDPRGVRQRYIQDGIKYLVNRKDMAMVDKTACTRVSCSWDAAIFICYEPPTSSSSATYTNSWDYVAAYAQGIISEWCPKWYSPDTRSAFAVRGRVWAPDGLIVSVQYDDC